MDFDKIVPVLELYGPVIQSEGSKVGIPHIVVRTTGCVMRCHFGEGGFCDSWYTSIHPEKGKYTMNDIVKFMMKFPECNHLMLTGGSPTMHPQLCDTIVQYFKNFHRITDDNGTIIREGVVTLETEGSHIMVTTFPIDLISLSPKFSNSIPVEGMMTPIGKKVTAGMVRQHKKSMSNTRNMRILLDNHTDYHFKPVVNPTEMPEVWDEVLEMIEELNIPKHKVWIMPPGDTKEELIRIYPMLMEFCAENGYNFTGRDHIIAFGDKREV